MASDASQQTLDPLSDHGQSYNQASSPTQAKRRLSVRQQQGAGLSHRDFTTDTHVSLLQEHNHIHLGVKSRRIKESAGSDTEAVEDDPTISLPSTSKQAKNMISPFLAKHIPQQYNPLGQMRQPQSSTTQGSSNTKYCYRHRPDLKCRRQADEPSMDQLQSELATLSQADQQAISHVWSLFSAAPSKHRQLMLQGVLAQCCFPQLSFISASVKNLIKIDFLSALPPELGFKILCYLDTASLCRAAQVSQRWRAMADDDVVWHRMCEQHIDRKCTKCGWGLPLLEQKRLRAEKRQVQLRAAGRGLNEWSPVITPSAQSPAEPESTAAAGPSQVDTSAIGSPKRPLPEDRSLSEPNAKRTCTQSQDRELSEPPNRRKRPWKDVYKDRFKVGTNWKYGRCSMKVFKGHTNGVMCLQFDDSILATGSYDTTIKIWDIESGQEIRTLSGHTAGIRCLQFDDTLLFSGSIDRTLKVWNWRTGECINTFTGPTGGIIGLHYSDRILACGSMDHTIRIWNLQDKSTFLLRGHTDWVNAVKIDPVSRTIFSASDDCTVRLWDLDTRQCIMIFKGHVGQVQQVLPLPHEFELGDDDEALDSHSQPQDSDYEYSDTGAINPEPLLTPYSNRLGGDCRSTTPGGSSKPVPPRYMLTGALDGTIRLWHVPTAQCIRTFFGHVEGIWALAADTLRLVSGAEDRMVKLWDPRTGVCERTFTGHAGPVTCVGLSDSRFATGSEDCEVRVYSFTGDKCSSMGHMGQCRP